MRTLYHHTLSPHARKVRLALHEKHLSFDERIADPWQRDPALITLNPAGEVPVLVEDDSHVIADATTICEYLEDAYPENSLLGAAALERAEARRLAAWFDHKFMREVSDHLVGEKLIKRVMSRAAPDSRALKAGRENLHTHLQYIAWLIERRRWLAGDHLTFADLSAAAQLSLLDYIGDVPWDDQPLAKEWYVRMKSRPSFRCLLRDTVPGVPPAPIYADLDF
ncbi:MAG: glutathione S-transferase family protein [Rhodospirillaceae bacterium]|nr:MAG: glutathione S-transferase family protein [Rhodospirillaceae bacterium]